MKPASGPFEGGLRQQIDLRRLVGDSRAAAYGILISRITGFGRVAAAGAVLGPTYFGNLFQTAAVVPATVYGFLMGTLISVLLVPPLVECINGGDENSVRDFANCALGLAVTILAGVTVVAAATSPLLLRGMTLGVPNPEMRRHQLVLGIPLFLTLMPQIVLYGVAGVGMALQQAHGRFVLCSVAPAVENLVIIGVLIASAALFGVGADTSSASMQNVLLLGLGSTSAVAAHACVQWIGAYRLGVSLIPAFGWRDPALRQLLRKCGSSVAFNALYGLTYLILLLAAGAVPGGVAAFQVAYSFSHLPVALAAFPVAAAQLPRLSVCYQRAALWDFRATYQHGLRLANFAVVPAALLLTAVPRSFAMATAFGAMNTPTAVSMLTVCIASLGLGAIGESMFVLATSSCYVRHDPVRPLVAVALRLSMFGLGVTVIWMSGSTGYLLLWTLGGSLAAANLAVGAYLHCALQRELPHTPKLEGNGLLGSLAAATFSIAPAALLSHWLIADGAPAYERAASAGVVLAASLIAYFVFQFFRGAPEARMLLPASENTWLERLGRLGR